MTVKIRTLAQSEGDKAETLTVESARDRVVKAIHQGWLVAKTYSEAGILKAVQVQKAVEVQDGDQLLISPPIAGG